MNVKDQTYNRKREMARSIFHWRMRSIKRRWVGQHNPL